MKKVIRISMISAIVLTTAIFTVNAQPGYGHKHGRGYGYGHPDSCRIQLMVDDMKQALDLSDKQVKEIEQIHYVHIQEVKSIDNKYKNDCVGAREARWALRDKMDTDVKELLNDEQKTKYDEFIDVRRGPHGCHQKNWK